MKWKKKRKGICSVLVVVFILGLFGSQVLAEEKVKVTKLERVEWTGIQLFGIKILGHWRPVRPGYTFWGAYYTSSSPYFRLNEDNQTVFRGLGRESNFAQALFPTLFPRENIENLLKPVGKAWESLEKFDEQRSRGEAIYMVGSFLYYTGLVVMVSGGLAAVAESSLGPGEDRSDFYWNVARIGGIAGILGAVAEFYGGILTQKALGHLDDAVHYFYETHDRTASRSSSLFLTITAENNKLMPVIGFTF